MSRLVHIIVVHPLLAPRTGDGLGTSSGWILTARHPAIARLWITVFSIRQGPSPQRQKNWAHLSIFSSQFSSYSLSGMRSSDGEYFGG